jgi:hypothetical protein
LNQQVKVDAEGRSKEAPAQPAPLRLFPATRDHAGAVLLGRMSDEAVEGLTERGMRRRRPGALPRSAVNEAVLEAWVQLLGPHFDDRSSVNLTGTYSDEYGTSHGLMLVRNVARDFRAAIAHERPDVFLPWCIGIEQHNTGRDVLHFHAMVGGDWSEAQMQRLKAYWDNTRGWSVAKPVSDAGGCVGYCAKHLLKRGCDDTFDFQLVPLHPRSRYERRLLAGAR